MRDFNWLGDGAGRVVDKTPQWGVVQTLHCRIDSWRPGSYHSTMQDPIQHVSDTAFWVAAYRADETKRSDALFQDPLAEVLVEGRGREIASEMQQSAVASWSVVVRTRLIDRYIMESIAGGVDMIVNLGAGLDTRPYRLALPKSLLWIEADFPGTMEFKNERLASYQPNCRLERAKVDLSKDDSRRSFLSAINQRGRKILIITEGVVPYLSLEEGGALAKDLHNQSNVALWVTDYLAPVLIREFLKNQLVKAPFKFAPDNWELFYKERGWALKQMRYLDEEGEALGRTTPPNMKSMIGFGLLSKV